MPGTYDCIVAGGGFAGTAAAVAAAREGLRVLLIEKSGALGGAANCNLVNPFMPYHLTMNGKKRMICDGLFREILERLKTYHALADNGINFNEEILKIVLDEMTDECGVHVLFHSYLSDVTTDDGRVTGVSVVGKSGTAHYTADYFIDATGDGDLAAKAAFPFEVGREEDGLCQPMTLCFRLGHVDVDGAFAMQKEINDAYAARKREGKIRNPREDVLMFCHTEDGIMHFNSTRVVRRSPLSAEDLSAAEKEARKQAFELYTFLKENFTPFKDAFLLSFASEIGVRESRRIIGEHRLTTEEIKACTKFSDGIAACNYEIDIHSPTGEGTSHYHFAPGEFYTIPYRALLPKGSKNLLVAGRCISASHDAQASLRIMPVCCTLGQAAGTAVALAAHGRAAVGDIDTEKLRKSILRHGGFLG